MVGAADEAGLAAAARAIEAGQPIVIPTDTVYGVAVRAGDADALATLFTLKRRPDDLSIAVLVADLDQAASIAAFGPGERAVADTFWPGALTLVLTRRAGVDDSVGRADGTVGVRCPDHRFVRDLARRVGPLATSLEEQRAAAESLDGEVAVIIDEGPCLGEASTVARIEADGRLTVFRSGALDPALLEQFARSLER